MSTPNAGLDRAELLYAAGELATELKAEMARLGLDAQAYELRGQRRWAADARAVRVRFGTVLRLAEAVLATGRST